MSQMAAGGEGRMGWGQPGQRPPRAAFWLAAVGLSEQHTENLPSGGVKGPLTHFPLDLLVVITAGVITAKMEPLVYSWTGTQCV